ncbi:hypothetical protein HKI87_11g66920 [Chloropicon roscoffensis]|uniref:Uncharacterized protein n=1 Tax=Chloropicon roscoffensis TaxID=1461544 RepID=A0AAX4PHN8_9CHLO
MGADALSKTMRWSAAARAGDRVAALPSTSGSQGRGAGCHTNASSGRARGRRTLQTASSTRGVGVRVGAGAAPARAGQEGDAGAAAEAGGDASSSEKFEQGMAEYAELKSQLTAHTCVAGAAVSAYFFLVWSTEAALGAALGAAGSYFYLKLLLEEVDGLPLDYVPYVTLPMERIRKKLPPEKTFSLSEREPNEYLKAKMVVQGPTKQALKSRMLIPVGLAAAASAVNALASAPLDDEVLPRAAVLLGFLSFKAALVVQLWNQLKVMLVPKFDVDAFLKKYEE